MTTALAAVDRPQSLDPTIVAQVILSGDVDKLNDQQRLAYCTRVCESLGLNPLTQPFAFIRLNGKLRMYALKDATEQLRKIHGVSITEMTSQRLEDVFVVTVKAQDTTGRTDAATGAVPVGSLKGEALANALMKAETKAKRRATLSICGLGILDELEVESIPQPVVVEAPPVAVRAPLPEGCFYIVKSVLNQFGGDVTVLDEHGVEFTYPTPDRQCAELCEQIAQENPPVPVRLSRVIGARDKKEKIKAVTRWTPPLSPEEIAELDAEIAAKEGLPL